VKKLKEHSGDHLSEPDLATLYFISSFAADE
jgi:hypothetical protein